jgi:hypothetical protein
MKITVSEGLRLKNEIKQLITSLTYEVRQQPVGLNYENGVLTSNEEDKNKFSDSFSRLEKLLNISLEINSKLSNYNRETGIDDKVRKMHNIKLLSDVFKTLLPKTKPSKTNTFHNVGNERKQVTVEYQPLLTGKEVKEKESQLKKQYRELQNEIEKLNAGEIEVSFTYEDIEQ